MTKDLTPLEALERLYNCPDLPHRNPVAYLLEQENLPAYRKIIEKALKRLAKYEKDCLAHKEEIDKKLKALEIIKEKQVDVGRFILIINTWFDDDFALHRYNDYLENDLDKWKLTKEEFDLLKEVLK